MSWKILFSSFVIILFFVLSTLSNAADEETWSSYVEDCRRLNNEMDTVKKQIMEKQTSIFSNSIRFRLRHIENYRKKVALNPNDPEIFTKCEDSIEKGMALLDTANKYEAELRRTQEIEAKKRHENAPELKKARSLGYNDFGYIDSIKDVFEKGGLEKLKQTLFFISDSSKHYRITQKIDNYLIYTILNAYENFVELPKIAIQPLKGEFIQKGNYIPGRYYKILGLVEFTRLDGFPITLPLLERVMEKEEMAGYGTPPTDAECRRLIIGSWSKGWYEDGREIYTYIDTYKPDGIYELIKYAKALSSGTWEKYLGTGTWKIENHIIQVSEKYSGTWKKTFRSASWEIDNPTIHRSGGKWSSTIIKLRDNTLIAIQAREEKYIRLKDSELSEAKSKFGID